MQLAVMHFCKKIKYNHAKDPVLSKTVKECHPHPVFKAMFFQRINFCCLAPEWLRSIGLQWLEEVQSPNSRKNLNPCFDWLQLT